MELLTAVFSRLLSMALTVLPVIVAVLLVRLERDEVMDVPDRILVMYEGEIVGELDPKTTTQEELGLYMAGAKRDEVKA